MHRHLHGAQAQGIHGCVPVGAVSVEGSVGAHHGVRGAHHVPGVRAVVHIHHADHHVELPGRDGVGGASHRGKRLRRRRPLRRSAHPGWPGVHAAVPAAGGAAQVSRAEDGRLVAEGWALHRVQRVEHVRFGVSLRGRRVHQGRRRHRAASRGGGAGVRRGGDQHRE